MAVAPDSSAINLRTVFITQLSPIGIWIQVVRVTAGGVVSSQIIRPTRWPFGPVLLVNSNREQTKRIDGHDVQGAKKLVRFYHNE
jgi:hypothetical protein